VRLLDGTSGSVGDLPDFSARQFRPGEEREYDLRPAWAEEISRPMRASARSGRRLAGRLCAALHVDEHAAERDERVSPGVDELDACAAKGRSAPSADVITDDQPQVRSRVTSAGQ
jgi:hypothetical protein